MRRQTKTIKLHAILKMPSSVKIYNIRKTCPACPAVFEGEDSDGIAYRFKFRNGKLSIYANDKLLSEFTIDAHIKSSTFTFDELCAALPHFEFVGENTGIQEIPTCQYDDEAFVKWLEMYKDDQEVVITEGFIMITPKRL